MKIKICGVKTEEDIAVVVRAGATSAGLLVGQIHASPDFVLPSTAARLAENMPPYLTPVLVTHLPDADSIIEIIKKTGITTVQLHGGSPPEEIKKICDALPLTGKIIYAAHVITGKIMPNLDNHYPYIDAVLLDSYNLTTGQVGGTGQVHDWNLSARFVSKCPVPVILAGGLTPENIADAIRTVRPFGIDANSGLRDENGNRSQEKCTAFVHNALKAWMSLE